MKREELKNGYYWVMPQRGYYKDKWVIATYENGMFWIHGTGEAFMPGSLTINYNKIPMTDPLPPAEGAEEILASLIESLGEPDNSIHDHSYEIRPLTVNGKCEWWMFHNGVGSGEPLAQWLQNFAALHAQRIAEKMGEEKLREELIKFLKWDLGSGYGGMTDEEIIDEYLKSREK